MDDQCAVNRYRLDRIDAELQALDALPGKTEAIEQRVKGLETWLGKVDSKVDRLLFAILGLSLTIAGSAAVLVLTIGGGGA